MGAVGVIQSVSLPPQPARNVRPMAIERYKERKMKTFSGRIEVQVGGGSSKLKPGRMLDSTRDRSVT